MQKEKLEALRNLFKELRQEQERYFNAFRYNRAILELKEMKEKINLIHQKIIQQMNYS